MHHACGLAADSVRASPLGQVMGLESWQQDDRAVVAGQPADQLPMELVHQVGVIRCRIRALWRGAFADAFVGWVSLADYG